MPQKRIRLGFFAISMLGLVLLNGIVGAQGSVITTISVPFALTVSVNPTIGTIYAGGGDVVGAFVAVIDGTTNTITQSIPVEAFPSNMAVNVNTNRIYLPDINNDEVIVVDGSTHSVLTTIMVGTTPYGIAVNSTTNRIYVSGLISGDVDVIDGSTNTVVDSISFGEQVSEIAVNPTTNRIYVSKDIVHEIAVIDGSDNSIITTIDADGSLDSNPSEIAINDFTNQIYLAIVHPGTFLSDIVQIDGDSNLVVDSIPLPDTSNGIAVNSVINHIYSAATNQLISDSKIYTIDGNTNSIIDITSIGKTLYDVDADPVTSRVYVVGDLSETVGADTQEYARLSTVGTTANLALLQSSDETGIAVYQDILPPLVGPKRNYFRMDKPTLTWSGLEWATGYEIQVDNNSDFKSNEFHDDTIGSGMLSTTTTVLGDGQYYWRVRGKRPNGMWGSWSIAQTFAVNA